MSTRMHLSLMRDISQTNLCHSLCQNHLTDTQRQTIGTPSRSKFCPPAYNDIAASATIDSSLSLPSCRLWATKQGCRFPACCSTHYSDKSGHHMRGKERTSCCFAYSSGSWRVMSMSLCPSCAFRFQPAPGNHAGIFVTRRMGIRNS